MLRTSTVNTAGFGMTPACQRFVLLGLGGMGVGLLAALRHGGQPDTTEVHASTLGKYPDLEAVRQQGIPVNVSNVIKTPL